MNRWDEIQATARDIASNVHADPAARDAMADDLIKVVGLMIGAVGKAVAIEGETDHNEVMDQTFKLDTESIDYSDAERAEYEAEFERERDQDAAKAHNRYLLGEQVQQAAREAVQAASNRPPGARGRGQGVDLDRWKDHPSGWKHVDRRPVATPERIPLRDVAMDGTERTGRDATTDNHRCDECNRVERFGHYPKCVRNSNATLATADDELQLGTVVYRDFEEIDELRQGIVLGPWPGARNDRVVVWWPRFGAATPETLQYEADRHLVAVGSLDDISPQRLRHLRGNVGSHDVAAPLIRVLDAALGATDRNSADDCCHGDAPCPWSKVKAGGCCFPKNAVCPLHH